MTLASICLLAQTMMNPMNNDFSVRRKTYANKGSRLGDSKTIKSCDNASLNISQPIVSNKDKALDQLVQLPDISSYVAASAELDQADKSVLWDAFRNLIWFRRLFFVYFTLLILQGVNAFYHPTWYVSNDIIWNPVATSCVFFLLFLCGIAYQHRLTGAERFIKWPTLQDLNGTSIFFATYLVLSPLLIQVLHTLNLHICQSVWHPVLVSWAFFILFLSSPLYDLVVYLGTLVPAASIRSYFQKNAEKKIALAQILSGQQQINFNIKNYKFALDMFEERLLSWRPLSILILGLLFGAIVQAVVGICTADFLTHALQLVFIVPTVFPLLALGGALLWKRTEKQAHSLIPEVTKKKPNILRSLKTHFEKRLEHSVLYEFPMISVFLAILTGISMFTFLAVGNCELYSRLAYVFRPRRQYHSQSYNGPMVNLWRINIFMVCTLSLFRTNSLAPWSVLSAFCAKIGSKVIR